VDADEVAWRRVASRPRARHASLIAMISTAIGCSPMVVDAFEPDPLPVAMVGSCSGDPAKSEPGICGCGIPDDDFDGDGTPDCLDRCPDNAGRTEPVGACGCSAFSDTARCDELRAALRNLYTFDGEGTSVADRQGGQDGTLLHTIADTPPPQLEALQQFGRLTFDGRGSYVELPSGMISSLGNATFEAWIIWQGDEVWSRIFDFGDNGGVPTNGISYLFLTPASTNGLPRVVFSVAGPSQETVAEAVSPLPAHGVTVGEVPDHIAVVIDRSDSSLRLYSGGVEVRSVTMPSDLAAINDVNDWLGRSNYLVDPALSATLIEFRIYQQALSASQISASFQAGPGALD
jgi:hypothetical protein